MMSCQIRTIPPGPTRRRVARRRKRGLSALTATLLLSLGLAAGFVGFAQSEALRLRDAQINRLDRWARQEARALHFWLHEAQDKGGLHLPGVGSARLAGNTGGPSPRQAKRRRVAHRNTGNPPNGLLAHRAPWASAPRGFRAQYVIANPRVQANNPDNDPALMRAHGILVIHAHAAITGNERLLLAGLCRALASSDASARRAEALARKALRGTGTLAATDFGAPGCDVNSQSAGSDPGRAIAVFAAPLAGINEGLVLRAPRAGFAPPAMGTDLVMNGHGISGIRTMGVTGNGGIETPLLVPPAKGGGSVATVTGKLTVEGDVGASHLRAQSAEVAGGIDVRRRLSAVGRADSRLDVTGWLDAQGRAGRLTLSGPGPQRGVDTLSVGRCRPQARCRGRGRGTNGS